MLLKLSGDLVMFYQARIKLTAWYLLVIMVVSGFFSVVIYRVQTSELERFNRVQLERIQFGFRIKITNPDLIEESKERIRLRLIYVNLIILFVSGIGGYILAGRTLAPIQVMLDDQSRFVADASHELRTPLTSLKTAFEVFLRGHKLNVQISNLINESITEVDKLQLLTSSLLRLSKTKKIFERFDLSVIVKKSALIICPQAKTILKEEWIKGDPIALEELIVILLDNAVKYSPKNYDIKIVLKKIRNLIVLTITDRGLGISEEDLPHIFERFYRGDKTRSSNGFGLGLSIAKKIVSEHGGTINVRSQLNKGSTFQVTFSL